MGPTSAKSKGKVREPRSRNTTPISTGSTDQTQSLSSLGSTQLSYDEILERYCRGSSPPPSATLKKLAESLRSLGETARLRSDLCDRGMRETSKRRKEAIEVARDHENAERAAEEERRERARAKQKKEREEERPLAVGAHSLARQDGVQTEDVPALSPSALPQQGDVVDAKAAATSPTNSSRSTSENPTRPPPAVPQFQTFGPDPSTFDDPTIYHLRDAFKASSEEEKKEILGVTVYPTVDLHGLTPGTPPDRDLQNAKPTQQVAAGTYSAWLEPWVRPLTEEDIAFLKERWDRTTPFIIPDRGDRSYKDIWAEEDELNIESKSQNNIAVTQPSGSMEQMTDDVAETSEISAGPMLSRLLAAIRPERRPTVPENNTNGDAAPSQPDGDVAMENTNEDQNSRLFQPATYLADANQLGSRGSVPRLSYKEVDERLKAELRYIGLFSDDDEPSYAAHRDDEVAARLRYLQEELQRVSMINGARKARVLEVLEERMAQQEYSTIADDLDTQLNQAYLKRHRNIGKGKKNIKRAGGAGGGSHIAVPASGVSKPGVGEPIRNLMDRRTQWTSVVGPVVEFGKVEIPTTTIFDKANMDRLVAKEKESWAETQDQT